MRYGERPVYYEHGSVKLYRCMQCPMACILLRAKQLQNNNFPIACSDGGEPVWVQMSSFANAGVEVWADGMTKKRKPGMTTRARGRELRVSGRVAEPKKPAKQSD